MVIEESTEVVVTIRGADRLTEPASDQLRAELKRLREERYELDLYIRGSWRRRWGMGWGKGKRAVFVETLWPTWRLCGGDLEGGVILPSGTWLPATGMSPPPEIVLRGVRKRQV